jgi:3-hydroxyisobutyrate dehydrogenase-like beta-hydroxyacid dehydrogenase
MAEIKGKVGVVGLGIMGGAIARNLAKSGWDVAGFDVDAGRRNEAQAAGVTIASSAVDVASKAPTIIMSLPSAAAAHAVARELAAAKEKRVVVETSTLTLKDKEEIRGVLEAAGHTALDCPLSGTGAQAQTGDLVVFASGDSAAIASLLSMFAGFSREAHDLGAFGNGSRMKFVANLLVAINNVASAEAMVLAERAGLDLDQVVKLVSAGAAQSRIFGLRAPMMANDNYQPATMRLSTWKKDMDVIGEFAYSLGAPTPLFNSTIPIYAAGLGLGLGDEDVAAVCTVLEKMSGTKRA